MRHITRACWLAVIALASCATVAPPVDPAVPAALRPFADAARFLLPGQSSLAFYEEVRPDAAALPADAPRVMRVAKCGSNFEAPKGTGYGRFRGVEVIDFGPGLLRHYIRDTGEPTTWLGGVPVWFAAETDPPRYCAASWRARVDDRFLVWSSEREVLEHALTRPGNLESLLQPFAAVHVLPVESEAVVCALPRPDDTSYWGRPLPIEPLVVCVRRAPRSLLIFHRQELPKEFTTWYEGPQVGRTTEQHGPWLISGFALGADALLTRLMMDVIFGQAIAV